jgi:hypothetical protein
MSWRPYNETAEDLALESAAASRIATKFNCEVVKLSPMLYQLDWAFFRNEMLVAWGEYRNRAKRYATYILSHAKWMKSKALVAETGKPCFLFVEWPDGLFYYEIKQDAVHPVKLFENFRGQNGDTEPCVHIPINLFSRKI